MHLARRGGLVVAAAVVGAAAVLAVEIQLARAGARLPDLDLVLDRPGAGRRVVWLGDSTAAGVGASTPAGALPSQVAVGSGGSGVSVAVLAVSGARVADVLADQVPKVAGLRPDLVLISVGANDTIHLTGRGVFRHTYEELVRALPPGVPVVLLGVPDMGAIPRFAQPLRAVAGWRGRNLDAEVRWVAARTGAVYADIAGPTGPPFRHHPDRYFAADDFHPSDAGYGLWADAVLNVLRREGLPQR
ncbi:MAG TPA: SGNH/GDSL hydrolase family protein [Acidimicrobiia bacterium]|nr:SGNH/GDSL hydrolase family protein [Acidimicrobiia bacterium]